MNPSSQLLTPSSRFRIATCILGTLAFATAFLPRSRANLIINGQFENPSVTDPNKYYTLTTTTGANNVNTLPNWTFVNDTTALYGKNYTNTIPVASGGYVSDGQLIDLTNTASSGGGGGISQTIATVTGQKYSLTLVNYNYGVNGAANLPSVAGGLAFNISATGTPAQGYYTAYRQSTTVTYNFTATSNSTTISINDRTQSDSNASWIDNVDVEVVPEFSHWAVFVAFGLLVAGANRLRRGLPGPTAATVETR